MAVVFDPIYDPVLVLDKASKRALNRPDQTRPTYKRHNSKQELDDKDEEGGDGDGDGINEEFFVDVYRIARKEQVLVNNRSKRLRLGNDDDSYSLLLQLQQRSQSWPQAGIATIIFFLDDHWLYTTLGIKASRMSRLTVSDLNQEEAIHAIELSARSFGGRINLLMIEGLMRSGT
ncbi:hypothetical protein PPACK8108_LOCUS13587 [Phakopsora pachyrhizi]|uniref:Uncharacterized protein n=1 Tax=Phakopsora pachyrhizi TaxID=170000 RepID=A0AAV0B3C8_PHAPC|nr:hypothetical protein PPACK8108_LOCUS13587 [Phakopsora pachyrhizi]